MNLASTLNSIKNSSVEVFEVILVIPKNLDFEIDLYQYSNLNIITLQTEHGGQVFQRSEGFKIVKGEFVLQLDDDILFNKNFIESLFSTIISLPNKTSVSPLFTNRLNRSVYKDSFTIISRVFYAIFYFDISLKEGSINTFGKSLGVVRINKIFKVDWLPGGCVLHSKKNLILDDYFPFKSKAFMEDLFHSHYLKLNGITLYIDSNLQVNIVEPKEELNVDSLFIDKKNEFIIRKYYFSLVGLNFVKYYWSCFVDIGITFLKYVYLKIFEK
jgi:hypothetical protein